MKKFEFTGETRKLNGRTLHRIRALIDIKADHDLVVVKAGQLGGWLEKEENLSHGGNAWVYYDARVYDDATVYDNAWIRENAWVCENATVCENACIEGNARIGGNTLIYGNAHIGGDACITGNPHICDDAVVEKTDHYLTVGPIGSRNDTTTFFHNAKDTITVKCGCFLGTVDVFRKKVRETHGNTKHAVAYLEAATLAMAQIDTTVTDDKPPKRREIVKSNNFVDRIIHVDLAAGNNENDLNKVEKLYSKALKAIRKYASIDETKGNKISEDKERHNT